MIRAWHRQEILERAARFYAAVFQRSRVHDVPAVGQIRVALATDFLAMKLEAFAGRGNGDYFSRKDMEDVVALIDGRPELAEELLACDASVREYVAGRTATASF